MCGAQRYKPAWFDAWMRELLPKERYTVQELSQALDLGQKTLCDEIIVANGRVYLRICLNEVAGQTYSCIQYN